MKQRSLFTTTPFGLTPNVHHQLSETSHTAAKRMKRTGKASSLKRAALELLRQAPRTADEIAEILGETVLNIRPRVADLKREGIIESTSEKRNTSCGTPATVWRAK